MTETAWLGVLVLRRLAHHLRVHLEDDTVSEPAGRVARVWKDLAIRRVQFLGAGLTLSYGGRTSRVGARGGSGRTVPM